jgi:hypothetical protein
MRALLALPLTMVAPATGVVMVPGCGCSDEALAGVAVTVLDGATGTPICDATVVITDGNHVETLAPFRDSGPCPYFGAYERSGNYNVEASSGGRMASMNVIVTSETCHVTTRTVTLILPSATEAPSATERPPS